MDTSSQKPHPDKIAETLGLEPVDLIKQQVIVAEKIDSDYEYARGNMINIIEKGNEALNDMLSIAQGSQQSRAFEVVSDLVRTLAQTNKDLLELAKQKKNLDEQGGPKTINNNLFVGSTTELLKMLKNNNE